MMIIIATNPTHDFSLREREGGRTASYHFAPPYKKRKSSERQQLVPARIYPGGVAADSGVIKDSILLLMPVDINRNVRK